MEVKMEVTQKIALYVMWGVFLQVKGAEKSKSEAKLNGVGLWRSIFEFLTSSMEVKMEVNQKTTISAMWGVFL